MRRLLAYMASIISIIFLSIGLFIIMMVLSDPGTFGNGDLIVMFAFAAVFLVMGCLSSLGLIRFYKQHQKFLKVMIGIISLVGMFVGLVCIFISLGTLHSKSMTYSVASFAFGGLSFLAGLWFFAKVAAGFTWQKMQKSQMLYVIAIVIAWQLIRLGYWVYAIPVFLFFIALQNMSYLIKRIRKGR